MWCRRRITKEKRLNPLQLCICVRVRVQNRTYHHHAEYHHHHAELLLHYCTLFIYLLLACYSSSIMTSYGSYVSYTTDSYAITSLFMFTFIHAVFAYNGDEIYGLFATVLWTLFGQFWLIMKSNNNKNFFFFGTSINILWRNI